MEGIRARHDDVAHQRQQKLSLLLLLSNVGLAASAVVLSVLYDWNPEIPRNAAIVLGALVAVSWLALLVAAGAVGWLLGLFSGISPDPNPRPRPVDADFLDNYRMLFFYVGVVVNLAAFACFTEVTGGLSESPFVPVFVAFVLTGPQLSRFKTQSLNLLLAGVFAVILMMLLESSISKPATAAPHQITIAAVLLAVLLGGLLSYSEKPNNHNVSQHVRPPSRVRIYRDGMGNWRFSFYHETHRQDPILVDATSSAVTDGQFPTDLKERFEAYVMEMRSDSWGVPTIKWPDEYKASFAISLNYEALGE